MPDQAGNEESLRLIDLGPDSLLYFVHIPKTAGSSLYEHLDTIFLPQQVFPADRALWHREVLERLPAEAINAYYCLRGHLYHHQLNRFWKACRRKVIPFTVVRDPESQLMSEYDMVLNDENVPIHRETGRSLSFLEFLQTPAYFGHVIDNPQIQNATPGDRQAAHLLMQFEADPYSIPKDEWFERVVEKLEDYALVGIADSFHRTLQLLAYIFGWTAPHRAPHRNKMRGAKPMLSEEERAAIAQWNQVDIKLYEWASARFEKMYAEMVERLGLAADAQGEIGPAITEASGPRLASRLASNANCGSHVEVIHNAGLMLGHVSPSTSKTLNWIGPDRQATIRLAFPSQGNRLVHIEFVHWVSRRLLRGFQVFINGRSLPLVAHLDPSLATFVGFLPESWMGSPGSIVDIQLVAAEASSPALEGTNLADGERKCLGLSSLQFLPTSPPMAMA